MLIREVMTTPVVTVGQSDPVRTAIRVLYEHDITAAPVVDADGRLVGIVSELDLLRGEFEADPRASLRPAPTATEPPPARIADVMTADVVTTTDTADVVSLIDLMISRKFKSIPVVRAGALVGIVSRRDLTRVLTRPDTEIRADVLARLSEHPHGGWEVAVHDGIVELTGPAGDDPRHLAERLARTVPGVVRVRHEGASRIPPN